MMRKCLRWRTVALSLLCAIILLNIFVFLTLPSSRHNEVYYENASSSRRHHDDSQGISHLQAPRKRLNKSNFTSDSLGADGLGGRRRGGGGGGGGGAAWEEGIGDHPPLLFHGQGGSRFDSQGRKGGGVPSFRADGSQQEGHEAKKSSSSRTWSKRNNFTNPEVDAFVATLKAKGMLDLPAGGRMEDETYWEFLKRQQSRRKAGIQLPAYKNYKARTSWERFHQGIHQHYLYDPTNPAIDQLLKDMARRDIIDAEQKDGGTQIKLIITYDDEGQALFKPMRYPRETETLPDHFYFADYERHVAEIGAFHLDRALGFNRVPPVAGRLLNMTRDIRRLADSKLARTFFISPAGNLCFHGSCSYYCDSGHPICGHPDQVEGSLMAFLPPEKMARRQTWRNPWKRSYSKHRKAYWEVYDDLCDKVRKRPPYNTGRRLLDVIDMSVLDFLMGNLDRHHYETFRAFGNDSSLVHFDNGRGFGKTKQDELSCLVPLLQCCMVRQSTLQRLARMYSGPEPLSAIMRWSLTRDAVSPVLIEGHLQALDRRVMRILLELKECVQEGRTLREVIVDDGVY